MGKFDGPHFRVDYEDVVSIWVSKVALQDIPSDYFEEDYENEDDEPFNRFSEDFGFGYYDHDVFETHCRDGRGSGFRFRIDPAVVLLEVVS